MGLRELIEAYAIAQGAHTGGHFNEASLQGVPMDLRGTQEIWNQPDVRKDTDINGAGFAMQDQLGRLSQGTELGPDVAKMNALIKLSYIAGLPGIMNKELKGYGDINNMKKESGNKYVSQMLLMSALSDLLQKKDSRSSLGFMVENGQPGLMFNYKW